MLDFTLLKSIRVPAAAFSAADLQALGEFVLKAERVKGDSAITLEFTGHERIQTLNRHFRGVNRTTDVISFRHDPFPGMKTVEGPPLTGDIAINVVQAALQAKKMRHSLPREIRLLWIHAILHLRDYTDYEPGPRRIMFRRQNLLLRRWEILKSKIRER